MSGGGSGSTTGAGMVDGGAGGSAFGDLALLSKDPARLSRRSAAPRSWVANLPK